MIADLKPVVSKNTNERKVGASRPFRSSSTRGEPQIWGSEAMSAIRVPRPCAVLPSSSVGKMTLRLYGALSYSQNSARDLRCALNGA